MGLFSKLKKLKKKSVGGKLASKTKLGKAVMGSDKSKRRVASKPVTGGVNKPARVSSGMRTGGPLPATRTPGNKARAAMNQLGRFNKSRSLGKPKYHRT